MKRSMVVAAMISVLIVISIGPNLVIADAPPMGGNNWDANGVEWQYYTEYPHSGMFGGSYVANEYWTYWIDGYTPSAIVGPGRDDYTGSGYQENSVDVYSGKICTYDGRTMAPEAFSPLRSPIDLYFDKETLDELERFQTTYVDFFGGDTDSHVWKINYSTWPSSRQLAGNESWSYDEIIDIEGTGFADMGDGEKTYSASASSNTSLVPVGVMIFECYTVVKNDGTTNITEYWDKDGALACPVYAQAPAGGGNQTYALVYHDWPSEPTVEPCSSGGIVNNSFTTLDNVYVKGDWVTLMSSVDNDNLYDIWIGTTMPSSGTQLNTWGTEVASDINVGPQSGANVPGTFGPVDLGTLAAGTYYIVLDDEDGIYHLDNNSFEGQGQAWGSGYDELGTTSYDDGITGQITIESANTIGRYFSGTGAQVFGSPVNAIVDCTAFISSGTVTITLHPNEFHSQTSNDTVEVWYEIVSTAVGTFDLTLDYSGFNLNGEVENELRLWRFTGIDWEEHIGTVNTGSKTIRVTGITQFSDWVIGDSSGPVPPVPESITIVLVSLGMLALAGYIYFRKYSLGT